MSYNGKLLLAMATLPNKHYGWQYNSTERSWPRSIYLEERFHEGIVECGWWQQL